MLSNEDVKKPTKALLGVCSFAKVSYIPLSFVLVGQIASMEQGTQ
jgi:hypothetical protein